MLVRPCTHPNSSALGRVPEPLLSPAGGSLSYGNRFQGSSCDLVGHLVAVVVDGAG